MIGRKAFDADREPRENLNLSPWIWDLSTVGIESTG